MRFSGEEQAVVYRSRYLDRYLHDDASSPLFYLHDEAEIVHMYGVRHHLQIGLRVISREIDKKK